MAFILLIILAAASGAIGIHLWEQSSRINQLVQEVQQTRGDLYRQMKELFDAYFLEDKGARAEYDEFTVSVEKHFNQLQTIAIGQAEKSAIASMRVINNLFLKFLHYSISIKALITSYQVGDLACAVPAWKPGFSSVIKCY